MMLREIIKPKKAKVTVVLPEEMIGKTVEVIAFEVNGGSSALSKAQRLLEIEKLTKDSLVDLSGYKFDRGRANNFSG